MPKERKVWMLFFVTLIFVSVTLGGSAGPLQVAQTQIDGIRKLLEGGSDLPAKGMPVLFGRAQDNLVPLSANLEHMKWYFLDSFLRIQNIFNNAISARTHVDASNNLGAQQLINLVKQSLMGLRAELFIPAQPIDNILKELNTVEKAIAAKNFSIAKKTMAHIPALICDLQQRCHVAGGICQKLLFLKDDISAKLQENRFKPWAPQAIPEILGCVTQFQSLMMRLK